MLSIIIPAYNVERYIEDCLKSILCKEIKGNQNDYEIILINDGSTDTTLEKVKKFKDKYRVNNLNIYTIKNRRSS